MKPEEANEAIKTAYKQIIDLQCQVDMLKANGNNLEKAKKLLRITIKYLDVEKEKGEGIAGRTSLRFQIDKFLEGCKSDN